MISCHVIGEILYAIQQGAVVSGGYHGYFEFL